MLALGILLHSSFHSRRTEDRVLGVVASDRSRTYGQAWEADRRAIDVGSTAADRVRGRQGGWNPDGQGWGKRWSVSRCSGPPRSPLIEADRLHQISSHVGCERSVNHAWRSINKL